MRTYQDLPVAIDVPGRLGQEVTAFAEAEAGWQVVAGDGPLVPAFTIAARVVAGPCVVVTDGQVEAGVVRDALLGGALDVVAWPGERERLLAAPDRLRIPTAAPAAAVLGVAGTRGGTGTSTVALAIGATVAWAGGRALVIGDHGLPRLCGLAPWQGPDAEDLATLGSAAGSEVTAVSRPVPGVPGLAVLAGDAGRLDTSGWPYELVVADVGTDLPRASIAVAAADGSVAAAAGAGVVLVVEHGPLDRAAVAHALGRAPDGWLPYSHRVAQAGARGRVPSALPGSWIAALRGAVAGATG